MTYNLDPKQQKVRDEVRKFAEKHVLPRSVELDRRPPEFPYDIFKEMGKAKFLGFPTSKEYGGEGRSILEHCTLVEEMSVADAAIAIVMAVSVLTSTPIELFGNEQQKKKYLPKIASGEYIGAFALTEPGAGSDAAAQKTTAVLDGDHYVVNGEKIFITSGNVADVVVLICRICEDSEGEGKVSALIFDDPKAEGFRTETLKYKMGIRASTTGRLYFKNVRIPKENLLGEVGKGFRITMTTLDSARIGVASQAVGIAQRAYNEAVKYSLEREQFGKPISANQAIQWMLADMSCRLEASRLLTYKAAQMADNGEKYAKEAAQAKLYASESAVFCADRAVQIHGGYGYIGDFSEIDRLYRDARITPIYEGTSEVQRLVIANYILKGK